jgi:hypothetical protein
MALIQFGSLVTAARGSVGGTTFDISKGGATLRKKRSNVTCNTTKQIAAKNKLAQVAAAWHTLTASQVHSWNVGASLYRNKNRFGQVTKLSGMSLFYKLNCNLLLIDYALVYDFPVLYNPDNVILNDVTATISGSNLVLHWRNNPSGNSELICKASPPQSKGIAYNAGNMRMIGTFSSSLSNENVWSMYFNTFGFSILAGQAVYLSIYAIDNRCGVAGNNSYFQAIMS